jgi:hypothetical protein
MNLAWGISFLLADAELNGSERPKKKQGKNRGQISLYALPSSGDKELLSEAFRLACVVDTVKAIFAPISWYVKTRTTMV